MTDDIRTEIADTLALELRDGTPPPYDYAWCCRFAEVLVTELGLTQETDNRYMHRSRYVTPWAEVSHD
jgi:hypothetical protein